MVIALSNCRKSLISKRLRQAGRGWHYTWHRVRLSIVLIVPQKEGVYIKTSICVYIFHEAEVVQKKQATTRKRNDNFYL